MVESVAGSVVNTQLQSSSRAAETAQRAERDAQEASARAAETAAREAPPSEGERGGIVNIKV